MAIKEYPNKSSVSKSKSRYVQGGTTEINQKSLGWWERDITIEKNDVTDIEVLITGTYAERPDLVAFDYYTDATLSWIVLQYNDIVDIKEEFIAGKIITIPSKTRVYYDILVSTIKIQ